MRILIITEEDEFYIPLAIDHLLKTFGDEVLEVVCARNPLTPNKFKAACKFYSAFGLWPIITHAFRLFKSKFLGTFEFLNFTGRYYSVKGVCSSYNIPYMFTDNVNSPDFLSHCRELNIDIIASVSPSQIFKEALINIPKYECLNIHTAKLPKYRGLFPVYWAMACGEDKIGITVHYIEKGIDTGRIVLQDEVSIPSKTTLDNMLKVTKKRGAELLSESIKQVVTGSASAYYPEDKGSYYSFPTKESYISFKNKGYKLW
jgi:methionyl-tRNA formyltransferase